MKKAMLLLLSIVFLNFITNTIAISQSSSLNLILGTDVQFSQVNSELLQQKIDALEKQLNLTEDQKQITETLGIDSAKKLNLYKVRFIEEKNKLILMRKNGEPIQHIQAQIRVISSIKSRLSITRRKNIENFRDILNSQQQAYLEKFEEDLNQIKQSESNFSRENRDVRTRENFLNNLYMPN